MELRNRLNTAGDYNRSLAPPMRWGHWLWALVAWVFGPTFAWAREPIRRHWAMPLLLGLIGFVVLYPLDGPIARLMGRIRLGGDLVGELRFLGQYGALSSVVIIGIVIWVLDGRNRQRILDLVAAGIATATVVLGLKMLIGRPRPRLGDPEVILGPFGAYPVHAADPETGEIGLRYAWEFWAGISSDLWSMPSSHTSAAVVLSVFLAALYPRLRGLVIVLATIVACSRVIFGAHYPTDVVVGAAVGYAVAYRAVQGAWGRRFAQWLSERNRQVEHAGP